MKEDKQIDVEDTLIKILQKNKRSLHFLKEHQEEEDKWNPLTSKFLKEENEDLFEYIEISKEESEYIDDDLKKIIKGSISITDLLIKMRDGIKEFKNSNWFAWDELKNWKEHVESYHPSTKFCDEICPQKNRFNMENLKKYMIKVYEYTERILVDKSMSIIEEDKDGK